MTMKKIAIIYGSAEGIQKRALEQLVETVLDCTGEYPVCLPAESYAGDFYDQNGYSHRANLL